MNWKALWKYYLLFFLSAVLLLVYLFAPMSLRPSVRKTSYSDMYAKYKSDSMELERFKVLYDKEIEKSYYQVQVLEQSIARTDEIINRLLNAGEQKVSAINLDTLDAVQRYDYISDYFEARK